MPVKRLKREEKKEVGMSEGRKNELKGEGVRYRRERGRSGSWKGQ